MGSEIGVSKQWKDALQKYVISLFKDTSLEFYGVKSAKIKEIISGSLPLVEVRDSSTDVVFLLEDDSYLHVAFETGKRKNVLIRHLEYDTRLYARDGRVVHTVIIYTADVKNPVLSLNNGSTSYNPKSVLMSAYDGNVIFTELETKVLAGEELTDTDILKLIFLPLMKTTLSRNELAVKAVNLAKAISDEKKRNACIASTMAFASKFLSKQDTRRILEAVKMDELLATIGEILVEDAKISVAKSLLKRGLTIKAIAEDTGLPELTVSELQSELD